MRKRSKRRLAAVLLAVAMEISYLPTGGMMVSAAKESGNQIMELAGEAEASNFSYEELENGTTGYDTSTGNDTNTAKNSNKVIVPKTGHSLTASVKKQTMETLSQTEIPVYENGILVGSNQIYSGQYDGRQKGVLRLQDAKLKYYADGKFQSAFSGKLSGDEREGLDYSHVDFYVKNGIVDTSFQGVLDGFYVVNGIISSNVFESDPDDPSHSWCSNATGLSIKNTTEGVSVGYDKNTYGDDRGFYVYRLCHETGEFVFFSKMDGNSTGFVDKNVERDHTYTYYIWTYSLYNMWDGGGYLCGFVDLSIVYGGNDSGKINTFESFSLPDDSEAEDPTWELSDEGVLTIFGNGSMPDYDNNAPWSHRKNEIKSVVVTDGITSIGKEAFFECKNLERVEFASSVEIIKSGAFYHCTSLQNVELGEGMRMIDDYAFDGTTSLTTIRLPASLAKISTLAFCNAGLEHYEAAEESAYMVQDGVLFNAAGTILLSYPCRLENEVYSIPSNVDVIDKCAFQFAVVKSVDIPDSVTTIKESAFSYSELETLVIPDSVTEVGYFVLYNCKSLKELQVGSGLKSLSYQFAEKCTSLENLSFAEGLEEISMRAFGYDSSLKSVVLPSSVEIIDGEAFGACTLLENVIFSEGLKRIESRAFYGTAIFSVDLPDSLNYVGGDAFPAACSLNFSESSKLIDFGGYYQRGSKAQIEAEYNYDMAYQVLEQVNQRREENGLGTLKMDEELLDAAMLRAAEISIYFSHDRPSGQSCFTVNSKVMAENIAAGNNSAVSVMDSWMSSSGHKANILGEDYKGIGIGCVLVNGTYYWVQLFSGTEVDIEADENSKQNFSEVISVLLDRDGAAGKGFTVSVVDNKIEKEDKTNILVRFYNGYRYTLLYSESISYSSSDQSVVTVSPEGEVTGVAEGTAEVTAYLTDEPEICGTVTITVGNSSQATGSGDTPDSGDGSGDKGDGENVGSGTTGGNASTGDNSTGDKDDEENTGSSTTGGNASTGDGENAGSGTTGGNSTDNGINTAKKSNRVIVPKSAYNLTASAKEQTITSLGAKATGGTITYESDNKNVTVSAKGKVTIAEKFVGTATIIVTAQDSEYETATTTVTVDVAKAFQSFKNAVTKKTIKRAKKAQSFQIGAKAKGKVSYKVTKKDAKKVLTVSKTGKVTIKKNAKAGTYTVKVKATAAAKGIYKKTSKTYTIKVTVKNGKRKQSGLR